MQFYLFLGVICTFFAFNSQIKNNADELLIKKWKPIEISISGKADTNIPENAYLEFLKDKNYILDGKPQGTWEFDSKSKVLAFIGGEFGEKGKFDGKWKVDKLSKTELELSTTFIGANMAGVESPEVKIKLVNLP